MNWSAPYEFPEAIRLSPGRFRQCHHARRGDGAGYRCLAVNADRLQVDSGKDERIRSLERALADCHIKLYNVEGDYQVVIGNERPDFVPHPRLPMGTKP